MNYGKVLIPALFALALAASCKSNSDEVSTKVSVGVLTLKDTTVVASYRYPATIKGLHDASIFAQVGGRYEKNHVRIGQKVNKGDVLVELYDLPYKSALEIANAGVEVAKAQVETARLTYESKKNLFDQDVISEYQLKLAENDLLTAKAHLSEAEAQQRKAALELSWTKVTSPLTGIVGTSNYNVGDIISPAMEKPLAIISDNSVVETSFSITENDYLSLSREYKYSEVPVGLIMNNGERYQTNGRLTEIAGMVSASTGAVAVKARFDNPDGKLLSGGSCQIELSFPSDNAILIPRASIKEIQDKMFVFKVADGVLHQVEIKASRFDARNWMLQPGEDGTYALKAGDVITNTTNRLFDGTEVEVK